MGREAKQTLPRTCQQCKGTFEMTAKEIKEHARTCTSKTS